MAAKRAGGPKRPSAPRRTAPPPRTAAPIKAHAVTRTTSKPMGRALPSRSVQVKPKNVQKAPPPTSRPMPKPPSGRSASQGSAPQRAKPKAPTQSSGPRTGAQKGLGKGRRGPGTQPARRGGPTLQDVGKFAGDVSRNYAAGAAAVGRAKDEAVKNVGDAIKNRPVLTPPSYKDALERAKELQRRKQGKP